MVCSLAVGHTGSDAHRARPAKGEGPVFKIIYCIRRKAGLTHEQFLLHWLGFHGPIVVEHNAVLRIARYVQTTPLDDDFSKRVERRGVLQSAYDGVAEMYWSNEPDFRHAFTDPEALRIQKILAEDERNFIDHAGSARWIGREIVVLPDVPAP